MGETSARTAGFVPKVIGEIHSGATTAEDTRRAAREIAALVVDLILFAGGDGGGENPFGGVCHKSHARG
jgi:predicted polyphosphate/ATP-dependent NAD kinase